MSPTLRTCEAVALKLPPRDRARLAEHLIASLDNVDETENEQVWAEEAERRYAAYKNGRIASRPMRDVLSRARDRLR